MSGNLPTNNNEQTQTPPRLQDLCKSRMKMTSFLDSVSARKCNKLWKAVRSFQ